jgi:hypothetical protein
MLTCPDVTAQMPQGKYQTPIKTSRKMQFPKQHEISGYFNVSKAIEKFHASSAIVITKLSKHLNVS